MKHNLKYKGRKSTKDIPQYSIGGIAASSLSSTAIGLELGTLLGPAGNVLGAAVGAGVGLVKGVYDHFKEKKTERRIEAANIAGGNRSAAVMQNAGGAFNNYRDPWTAAKGGVVQGGQISELAGEEVSMGPDASLKKWDLPKHPNNSRIPLGEGSVVFPEAKSGVKLRKDSILYAKYKSDDMSVVADKIRKHKEVMQKRINSKTATPIERRTAERNDYNLNRELGALTGALLSEHQRLGINQPASADGVPQANFGTIVKGASKFLSSDVGRNAVGAISSLAPTLYNLGRSRQSTEQLNPANFQNPLAYDALQSMGNRQIDTQPMLANNAESAAIADANLRSSGAGMGAYRSGTIGIQNARMKANSAVLNQADMQNNAYRGELGQMQGALGKSMADTNLLVSDLNARNEAAGRNYGASAAGQLSQFAQTQQLMNNQRNMDARMQDQWKSYYDLFQADVNDGLSEARAKYKMKHPKKY